MDSHEQAAAIMSLSSAIMAQLRRDGRFPTRLDEEDYDDILQEGALAAWLLISRYDPDRGSLRAFMGRAVARAMLACAWGQAQAGITGDHDSLQVWSVDGPTDEQTDIDDALSSPDVAEEIEAFDHVWRTRYSRD